MRTATISTSTENPTPGGIVKPGNVALASNGTTVSGIQTNPAALLDGITTNYNGDSGYAASKWPCDWRITFDKPYRLREIRMKLWDLDARSFQYVIEGSVDGKKFFVLADRSKGEWAGWQQIQFSARPIKQIKIVGLHNTANENFDVVEFEAYCIPPASAPGK